MVSCSVFRGILIRTYIILLLGAFVISLNCTVRRKGTTQMFRQQRKARWGTWRHRRGLKRWAHWLGASDKLIGSEVINTGTLPSLSIDAICSDQTFKAFCPSSPSAAPLVNCNLSQQRANWCDKLYGCPATTVVAGGWKQARGEFLGIDRGKSWQSKPCLETSSVGNGFAFYANWPEILAGDLYRIKPWEVSLWREWFAGKMQQLP